MNGRLELIDVATDLPDGTELTVWPMPEDPGDALTADEEEGLRKALASLRRGEGIPFEPIER